MRSLAPVVALLACACTSTTICNPGDSIVNATLYMQSSAEYRAAALQTYATARRALDAALADPAAGAQPPAIILDLDETALDNARYAARSVHKGKTFQFDEEWSEWVREAAAEAVPGAREFLVYANSRGVTPFYITNRTAEMEADTRRNLEKLAFPLAASDTVLVRGERPEWNTFDKTPRRDYVAAQYRVLLLLGDDLNDFTAASGKSVSERAAIVDKAAGAWGTRWIIVPNPIYGSWESAVTGGAGTPCEQMEKKVDSLEE
jgi:acid phosphatase